MAETTVALWPSCGLRGRGASVTGGDGAFDMGLDGGPPARRAAPGASAGVASAVATAGRGDHTRLLAESPLFADLDGEGVKELAAVTRRSAYQQGEIIFHRDDPGLTLFIIRTGRVRIYITSPEGHEVSLAVFGPGDAFGELALFDGQPRSASAIAIEPVETYCIQREDFISVATRRPRIALQMLATLSRRLRSTDALVEDLLFLDVHGRVAKKLLELAETNGARTPNGIRIELKLTQSDLAAMVGASRESVNKVMSYMLDKDHITIEKRVITVKRLAELRQRIC